MPRTKVANPEPPTPANTIPDPYVTFVTSLEKQEGETDEQFRHRRHRIRLCRAAVCLALNLVPHARIVDGPSEDPNDYLSRPGEDETTVRVLVYTVQERALWQQRHADEITERVMHLVEKNHLFPGDWDEIRAIATEEAAILALAHMGESDGEENNDA